MAIRRVTYERILHKVMAARGVVSSEISVDESTIANLWINRRFRFAWDHYYWPGTMKVEKRQFRESYAAATSYSYGDEVYYPATGKYYLALRSTSFSGQAPATKSGSTWTTNEDYWADCQASYNSDYNWASGKSVAVGDTTCYEIDGEYYQCHTAHTSSSTLTPAATGSDERWGKLVAFVRDIDYEQSWESNAIGQVKDIWDKDPYVYQLSERVEQLFELFDTGVVVRGSNGVVYVEFQTRCPDLTGSTYSSSTSYDTGDIVYSSSEGDYFESLTDSNSGNAVTDDTKWERLEIPRPLSEYVAQGAAADFAHHTDDDAEVVEYGTSRDEAMYLLRTEIQGIELRQRQSRPLRVRTRLAVE